MSNRAASPSAARGACTSINQPPGWDMLGIVQRGDEIGALARNKATAAAHDTWSNP